MFKEYELVVMAPPAACERTMGACVDAMDSYIDDLDSLLGEDDPGNLEVCDYGQSRVEACRIEGGMMRITCTRRIQFRPWSLCRA